MANTKIPFRSAYDRRVDENTSSPAGSKIVLEHREEISLSGKRVLIRDRKVNVYEKIQSSRESCEIQTILRRAAEGDMGVLNMVNAQYLDITGAPTSLAQAQQFVIRVNNEFEKLPKEMKAKFNYNAQEYVAEYGTETWADKTGLKAMQEAAAKEEEATRIAKENMEKAFANLAEKGSVTNE